MLTLGGVILVLNVRAARLLGLAFVRVVKSVILGSSFSMLWSAERLREPHTSSSLPCM